MRLTFAELFRVKWYTLRVCHIKYLVVRINRVCVFSAIDFLFLSTLFLYCQQSGIEVLFPLQDIVSCIGFVWEGNHCPLFLWTKQQRPCPIWNLIYSLLCNCSGWVLPVFWPPDCSCSGRCVCVWSVCNLLSRLNCSLLRAWVQACLLTVGDL
jgi:hypothetical protein